MNQHHWLTEQLNAQHSQALRQQVEKELLAQTAQEELPSPKPRHFVAKLRAELSDLSTKSQDETNRKR